MIVRVFQARPVEGKEAEYERLLREEALPLMRKVPGLRGLYVGRALDRTPPSFLIISLWPDLAAMQALVGENWAQPMALPGEADLVAESTVHNYESLAGEPLTG